MGFHSSTMFSDNVFKCSSTTFLNIFVESESTFLLFGIHLMKFGCNNSTFSQIKPNARFWPFAKIFNESLTIFAKHSVLDVWLVLTFSNYATDWTDNLLQIYICLYIVFTLQPKFNGCLQMTYSSFARMFARLPLASFENVLSGMCHHP